MIMSSFITSHIEICSQTDTGWRNNNVHGTCKLTCEGQTTTPLKSSCSDSGLKAPHLCQVKG